MTLKITVLLENRRRNGSPLRAKAGLSLLVEDGQKTILFDTGPDDSFLHNAALLGIDPGAIDVAVLSHGHYDHCGGVAFLPDNTTIICHPDAARERHAALTLAGRSQRIKKLSLEIDYSRHRMIRSASPVPISDSTLWSGEITVARPKAYGLLDRHGRRPDFIVDEGALVHQSARGLTIITGCGHRGIVNIVRHCQRITGIEHVHALIGGFHLRSASPLAIRRIGRFLRAQNTERIVGCHCTGMWGNIWLSGRLSSLATGDIITI